MYRDDGEAAQLRIQTLEAKLAEREAGLTARDAEIAELQREVARFEGRAPRSAWPRVWPILACLATGALGLAAGLLAITRAPGPPQHSSDTGLAVCDLYLERFEGCMARMPSAAQGALQQAMVKQREAFTQAAQTPEGRAALRNSCAEMLDGLATNPMCKR